MSKVYVVEVRSYKIRRNARDYAIGMGSTVGVFDSKKKAIEYICKWYNTKCLVEHYVGDCRGWYVFEDNLRTGTLKTVLTIKEWEVNKGEMDELEALL